MFTDVNIGVYPEEKEFPNDTGTPLSYNDSTDKKKRLLQRSRVKKETKEKKSMIIKF